MRVEKVPDSAFNEDREVRRQLEPLETVSRTLSVLAGEVRDAPVHPQLDESLDMIQECCRILWILVQLRPIDYVPSNCVELTTKD